jgi:hypothetical protein
VVYKENRGIRGFGVMLRMIAMLAALALDQAPPA